MNNFDWLVEFTKRRGFKHRDISEILNVRTHTVDKYFSDREIPQFHVITLKAWDKEHPLDTPHTPPEVQAALTRIGGTPLDYAKTIELRLFASLPATTWGEIGELVEMMPVFAHQSKGADGIIKVVGDCMKPKLSSGDYVFVRLAESAEPGQIVVARNGDGEYTLKRLRLVDGKLLLSADATPQEAIEASKAQIVAVCIRKYRPAKTEELL